MDEYGQEWPTKVYLATDGSDDESLNGQREAI